MTITGWEGTHYVHHDVAEPGVRDLELADIDQLLVLFNSITGHAGFDECLDVTFDLGPVIFARHPGKGRLDPEVVVVEAGYELVAHRLRYVRPGVRSHLTK